MGRGPIRLRGGRHLRHASRRTGIHAIARRGGRFSGEAPVTLRAHSNTCNDHNPLTRCLKQFVAPFQRRDGSKDRENFGLMLRTICLGFFCGALALGAAAQDTLFGSRGQQMPAPDCMNLHNAWEGVQVTCTTFTHDRWLRDLQHWRAERRIRIAYDGSRYHLPELRWTQSSFIQPQMMVHDRYFYDPVAGRYTVDRYLDDLEKRYGGIDAVLVWATYPNMGIDDRNQLEMVQTMPGGIAGLKQMVADFHRRGVRVLFPMMMWDEGTHPPPGAPDSSAWPDAIADLMKQIGADGINGDTQDGVPLGFTLAADAIGHPLAFEPEGGPSDEAL